MPEPGPGYVRVKVHVCGVCRTDLHVVEAELPPSTRPIIPGHQTIGVVDRLGAGVTTLKRGDRVGIAWLQDTCRTCEFCTTGRENLCEQRNVFRLSRAWRICGICAGACTLCVPHSFDFFRRGRRAAPVCGNYRISGVMPESTQARATIGAVWIWRLRSHHDSDRAALGLPGVRLFAPSGASTSRQTIRRNVGRAFDRTTTGDAPCIDRVCAGRAPRTSCVASP